jgi:hypothetical protein
MPDNLIGKIWVRFCGYILLPIIYYPEIVVLIVLLVVLAGITGYIMK